MPGFQALAQAHSPHAPQSAARALLVLVRPGDEEAIARIREVAQDLIPLTASAKVAAPAAARPAAVLTPRQEDILRGLLRGLSNKAIGRELGISHFTVRNHVAQLFQLLEVQSRQELASATTALLAGN